MLSRFFVSICILRRLDPAHQMSNSPSGASEKLLVLRSPWMSIYGPERICFRLNVSSGQINKINNIIRPDPKAVTCGSSLAVRGEIEL